MRITRIISGLAMLSCLAISAHAADYPDRPIRLIIPNEAGGTIDALGRIVATQINKQSNLGMFIENKPGANGMIGTAAVSTAKPDGYTFLNVSPSFVLVPLTKKKVPYDIEKDFTPITALGIGTGYLLVVRNDLPVKNVGELLELAKISEKPLTYGTPGIGNALHLATESFAHDAGIKMLHVPYKGSNSALTAIAAGQVDVMVISPATVYPFVESKRVRPIAFTGATRSKDFPDVPTMIESGFKDFVIKGTWVGWFAPAGTPKEVVNMIAEEVRKAVSDPKVAETLANGGFEADARPPEEFAKFVDAEFKRYGKVVKEVGLEPK